VAGSGVIWPDVLELSDGKKEGLRAWLLRMILAEYERIRQKG
jgi:hypothetical protein